MASQVYAETVPVVPSASSRLCQDRRETPMPPSEHRPAPRSLRARRRALARRRRRAAGALVLVVAALIALIVGLSGGSTPTGPHHGPSSSTTGRTTSGIPAVEAGLLPWTLTAPLSREVVLPGAFPGSTGSAGASTMLAVVGGLDKASNSSSRVYSLDTTDGRLTPEGQLTSPLHDAAGTTVAGGALVLGGGSPDTVSGVEKLTQSTAAGTVSASTVSQLPEPRSDAEAVTIGTTAYVIGGYDGNNPDPHVLATTDGQHFTVVGSLPVPVRYGAVAALHGDIYVFGGQQAAGARRGQPSDAIQMIDPSARTLRVVGHLPVALVGAAAATLSGHVYLAGGTTSAGTSSGSATAVAAAQPGGSAAAPGAASSPGGTTRAVYAFDPASDQALPAGMLPSPVAYAGVGVVGNRAWVIGGEVDGTPVSSVEMFTPDNKFGTAGSAGAGSPFFGDKLLIADRGNDRMLVLDDTDRIVWNYPSASMAAPPGGFYFPDDTFFAKHGTEIISNQEENETIVIIGYPSGQVLWQYGHPRLAGSAPGYLHEPDDAYLLRSGQVTVADAQSCLIQILNVDKTLAQQFGTPNVCRHQPPNYLGSPNGDTPLADGNLLISEINGSWVSEYTTTGHLVWTVQLPIHYPSDPQQLGSDLYLLSDYAHPGAIDEFNREGTISYHYQPTSGPGELNQPSLTELIPSGVFMANDDYRHRVVAIDPTTQALVWQYGVTDTPGTAPGMLNIPDGFDLLLPDGSTPTHSATS